MRVTQRIQMIDSLLDSVKESVIRYDEAEERYGGRPITRSADLPREDSPGSIVRRCILAREELLKLAKDFGYKTS